MANAPGQKKRVETEQYQKCADSVKIILVLTQSSVINFDTDVISRTTREIAKLAFRNIITSNATSVSEYSFLNDTAGSFKMQRSKGEYANVHLVLFV